MKALTSASTGKIWPCTYSSRPALKPLAVALLGATLLTACGGDDDNPAAIENGDFVGNWISAEDGQALKVESNKVTSYQYTAGHCLIDQSTTGNQADLGKQGWTLNAGNTRLTLKTNHLGTSYIDISYQKADELPAQCADDKLLTQYFEDEFEADRARDYQIFWDTFNEYYPAFERRGVDWDATNSAYSGQISADMSELQFFEVLASMVEPLEDSHISLENDDAEASFMRGETFDDRLLAEFLNSDQVDGNIDTETEYQAYVAYVGAQYQLMNKIRTSYATNDIKQAANDELLWYKVEQDGSSVGVLIINAMDGFIEDVDEAETLADVKADMDALETAITQALTDLEDTEGLIIDLRDNPGGHDVNGQVLVRHFLDTERTLYSKQSRLGNDRTDPEVVRLSPAELTYTKPVVILTSPMTESAAEVFTLAMSALPHVTVIGERSQGALADVLEKQLPGGASFSLVNEYYLFSNGDWYEGQGIPVAATIPFMTLEEREEEEDFGLEAAWEMLTHVFHERSV
tara:strand:- start:294 stop:1850 length:1557 start_codon:yes stop_codon:yes gene_type:complete